MQWIRCSALGAVLVAGPIAFAQQSLLNQIEGRVQQPGAAGGATEAVAAPGTGYLGAVLDEAGQNRRGVLVKKVTARGPAEIGGLRTDDLITAVDGKPIDNLDA